MGSNLIFEYSTWWLPVCMLAGAIYAGLLYIRVKTPWDPALNWVLGIIRFLVVSFIGILLISPFLNQTKNTFEKPLAILAVDNSQSMQLTEDSMKLLENARKYLDIGPALENSGYEVRYHSLNDKAFSPESTIDFDYPQTDLDRLLKEIQNDFEGRNLGSVTLLSDGIYNRGTAPIFSNFSYPVFSVGTGDTIPKKDIVIKNLLFNKITYQGNQFPLIAEIQNEGFVGEEVRVSISNKGKPVGSQTIEITRNNQLQHVRFLIDAEENGLQRYSVAVEEKEGEFTYANNYKQAYIDVIDGKEKILIVAPSPHPDIKAFSAAIEKNDNYETTLFIPGIHDFPNSEEEKELDLIIYHQAPDVKQVLRPYLSRLKELELPSLYIVGSQTSIVALNNETFPIRINAVRNESDLVGPVNNSNFSYFKLSDELEAFLASFPPVRVPFGQTDIDAESSPLLFQKVGSIETNRPLLLFRNASEGKTGVLYGEGLWQWRLFEYSRSESTKLFDELILKSIQFLASKEDRRKFRVYPLQNEFFENETVVLETEAYNSLYEPIYGIKVDLRIRRDELDENSYTFVTSESNSRFTIRDLQSGVYNFIATAIVNEKLESASGQFVVKAMDLEAINLTADHSLLKQLSENSGGSFYLPEDIEDLQARLISIKPPEIIHSSEKFLPMINLLWVFLLLLLLSTTEWLLRKYYGGY